MGIRLSFIIRRELKSPHKVISGHMYNTILTAHALMMIFFIVMPTLMGGFGNYLVPLIMGRADLVFPRLNIFRFTLLPIAMLFLLSSLLAGGGSGTG